MRNADLIQANQPGTEGFDIIYRMAQFFYRISGHTLPIHYRVEIYQNLSSDISVLDLQERFETRFVYGYELILTSSDID